MKKVGIMSMQRIVNYGSFLQAYGLKKTLENLGYAVQFVDYKYESSVIEVNNNYLKKIKNNINFIHFIKKKAFNKRMCESYNKKFLKMIEVKERNENPAIDYLVIGSDEVFNCLQGYPVGYSRELFGKNYENIPVLSYAASFGHTKLEELKKYGIDEEIKELLNHFKSISVRDMNSKYIVESLLGKNTNMHLDPVLIADFPVIKSDIRFKDYIILYAYTGRLTKREEKYIREFVKKKNKKIISIGFYQKIADYNLIIDPLEMFNYFKCADFVITDTFHGTIFSIRSHSKFCTIIRTSNRQKLTSLLEKLGQTDRIVNTLDDIESLYNKKMNYKETDLILNNEKKNSINYLKENLK